jgi:competence protein ComEC
VREPLLYLFAACACGILSATFYPVPLISALVGGSGCLFAAFLSARIGPRALPVASLALLLLCGAANTEIHRLKSRPRLSVADNVPAILEGCVVDPSVLAAERERFTVELAQGARAQVSVFARPNESFPELPYGARVEFTAKVRETHNYNNPGSFDAVHYLARQAIYWNASADASSIHVVPGHCGNLFSRAIHAIRSGALNRLDRLYARDAYTNGMMQAVLIGATAKLDRLWTEDYRSTGTFHALVISGGHVAVLAAVLLFFLRLCGAPNLIAIFATIAAAWLYAGITGWQAPVLRSAAGMTLFGIAKVFYRDGRLLNILAGVALFFVLVDPEQLFDASFQLSFLAVALIAAFVVPALDRTSGPLSNGLRDLSDERRDIRLQPRSAQFRVELRLVAETLRLLCGIPESAGLMLVSLVSRIGLFLWEIFITSFFIQIGLVLPMIVYFHRASVSGLSANAAVVPILSAVVPLGFLAIALNSHILAALCAWLLSVSRWAVGWHARWEPEWRIPSPPFWLAAAFIAALIFSALRIAPRRFRQFAWCCVAVSLAAIVLHPFPPVVARNALEVSAIDVGQGDSLFVSFPQGKLMLVDAGGIPTFGRLRKPNIDIGEDVVSPYLWSRSIKHLDTIVMTHAHEDHMGGMAAVLRNFHPKELWTGATQESREWISVRDTARSLHIAIREFRGGTAFEYGGARIQVLAPDISYMAAATPKNDDSLVMHIAFRKTAFLLTGDMEKKTEEQLFYSGLLPRADVLKVGHHGSHTSSTQDLLDTVHPAFALISDGFDNTYGHPHPATLHALEERHVAVYRTDRRGLIRIVSDGRTIAVD